MLHFGMRKEVEKQKLARELRKQGFSLNDIKDKVNAAKSSVSVWVKDIELSEKQLKQVKNYGQKKAGQTSSKNARLKREQYQQKGRDLAKANRANSLFCGGCMLYWAEGEKSRSQVKFANSDVHMHKYFLEFIRVFFPDKNIKAAIHCYTDVYSYEEILNYWSESLNLSSDQFRKPQINNSPKSSKEKSKGKQKLPYGTLSVVIHSVEVMQILYGAIQELGGFINDAWSNI